MQYDIDFNIVMYIYIYNNVSTRGLTYDKDEFMI